MFSFVGRLKVPCEGVLVVIRYPRTFVGKIHIMTEVESGPSTSSEFVEDKASEKPESVTGAVEEVESPREVDKDTCPKEGKDGETKTESSSNGPAPPPPKNPWIRNAKPNDETGK